MLQFPTYPLSLIAMYYSLGTDGKDESSITALRERESPRFQSWDESDMLKN